MSVAQNVDDMVNVFEDAVAQQTAALSAVSPDHPQYEFGKKMLTEYETSLASWKARQNKSL